MSTTSERKVGVIGTGNFARALAKRLYYAGYSVRIGSRRPKERYFSSVDECFCDVALTTMEECLKDSQILFVAVHAENYKDCLQEYSAMLEGKILVDVSNRDQPNKNDSNAEYLSRLLPNTTIVKGFNVISSYAMENENVGGNKRVFLASDDTKARERISIIARDLGFTPVDLGLLRSSRKIEAFPLTLLPEWRAPLAFTIGVFNFWLLYIIFIYFVEKTAYRWDQLFVKVLNKPLCMTAITVLAATFLASSVAAIFQIFYGTKHIRFPKWLDKWLKTRKQMGIIAFTLVVIHVIMSVLIMSPTYLSSWYQSTTITIPGNLTHDIQLPIKTWMVWKGEAACLVGILSFICLCFIAVSTLPSVADSLNWKEWTFIQSKIGHIALFLALSHACIMGAPGWVKNPSGIPKSITFLSSILPFLTILLRIILSLPCIKRYINKIRRGWERNQDDCQGECAGSSYRKPFSAGYVIVSRRDSSIDKGILKQNSETIIPMEIEEGPGCNCASSAV